MREIILYIAQSIDGYIAGKDGSVSWLDDYNNAGIDFNSFYSQVDVCVLGRTTYEQVKYELSPNEWPYLGKESFVLSSTKIEDENIVALNVDQLLETINNTDGKIWIVGGSQLLRFFLENEMVDKMIITTMPILLGEGISLFSKIDNVQKYKVTNITNYNGIIETVYER